MPAESKDKKHLELQTKKLQIRGVSTEQSSQAKLSVTDTRISQGISKSHITLYSLYLKYNFELLYKG